MNRKERRIAGLGKQGEQSAVKFTSPTLNDAFFKAIALHRAGDLDEAERLYRKILHSHPLDADLLSLLGSIELERGNLFNSLKLLDLSIASNPKHRDAYNSRGIVLNQLKRHGEALANYDTLLAFNPTNAHALVNRGIACIFLERYGEALSDFDKVIARDASNVKALINRSHALTKLKRYEEAVASADKAIALKSDDIQAYINRGTAYDRLDKYKEALDDYNKAVALNPGHAECYHNIGLTLEHLGHYEEALRNFERVIALNPQHVEACYAKAVLLLVLGKYEEGWQFYEWRWKLPGRPRGTGAVEKRLWLGKEKLAGKTILLHAEQGLGDAIQFCRYIPLVAVLGANVLVEVPASLAELVSAMQVDCEVIAQGEAIPAFDYHCPLMSLPLAFHTMVDTIPADIPYFYADEGKRTFWQTKLGTKTKPRVGLVWSGNPDHENDRKRSIHLKTLLPLLECDAEFHSLQKEVRETDAAPLAQSTIISHAENLKSLSDTAALIAEMDLVISVDTSVAHLAGALGKDVWIPLAFVPDYRWLLEREDSPWYPTARLFRQKQLWDWENVIARVKAQLQKRVAT